MFTRNSLKWLVRLAMLCVTVILIEGFLLRGFIQTAVAQVVPGAGSSQTSDVCPDFINQVIEKLEENCSAVGRNSACYGNTLVNATFSEEVPEDYFSQPADQAELITLQSISTTQIDLEEDVWGVALMSMQANLPGSLPGQSVNFLLFGDATVVNAVPPEEAVLPVEPLAVVTNTQVAVRTLPEMNANLAGSVPEGTFLEADALDSTGEWVRVVYLDPTVPPEDAIGGWVPISTLESFDSSLLPVISAESRTPMQAFLFRTGLGEPSCSQAPNQVLIQGPDNSQVNVNVNGADVLIGSTIVMTSITGAPGEILEQLDLPDDVIQKLTAPIPQSEDGEPQEQCGVMQLTVVNGEVNLNDGNVALPEGNVAYAVYCGLPPDDGDPETEDEFFFFGDLEDSGVDFSSMWGAFRPMTEEEIENLRAMEEITESVINYEIVLPDPGSIQPPRTITPTPTNTQPFVPVVPSATWTPMPTFTPTPEPPTAVPPTAIPPTAVPPTAVPPTAIPPGIPTGFGGSSGGGQSIPVGGSGVPFSLQVLDFYGTPVVGVPVTFTAPGSGASGTFAGTGTNVETVPTDGTGTATTSAFTVNTIAGTFNVVATVPTSVSGPKLEMLAKPAGQRTLTFNFAVTSLPGSPVNVIAVGGNGQSTLINTVFPQPLVARLVDEYGNGVPNEEITFDIFDPSQGEDPGGTFPGGEGGTDIAFATTNANGEAASPPITANGVPGFWNAWAYCECIEEGVAGFEMFNNPPPTEEPQPPQPGSLSVNGNGISAQPNQPFGEQLSAFVLDNQPTPMPYEGAMVTFTAQTSPEGASLTFNDSGTNAISVPTDPNGIAFPGPMTANEFEGTYDVNVVVEGTGLSQTITLSNIEPQA